MKFTPSLSTPLPVKAVMIDLDGTLLDTIPDLAVAANLMLTELNMPALPEATMLIVGVGGVGAETARIASAFGMRVIGIDARRVSAPPGVALLGRPEELDDLLPQADFVVLTIPHTPATGGLFDAARFARMKKGAYFINIGRGKTTHLDALTAALRAGSVGVDAYHQAAVVAGARPEQGDTAAVAGRRTAGRA